MKKQKLSNLDYSATIPIDKGVVGAKILGKNRKIVVGMSGGVDSSISLILLKKNGWNPVGVSLKFGTWENSCNRVRENSCCTDESIKTAQKICKKYNCEHVVLEVGENFHEKVIKYFTKTLKLAKTPNPCIICNRYLKFLELFEYARNNDIQYVATGHYAKKIMSKKYKGLFISKPKDRKKDQTYYLALLPQEWISKLIFPLSDLTKEQVYERAIKENLDFYLKLSQSQDFCFVSEKSLTSFIEKEVGNKKGNIINKEGEILGYHNGLANYTIGQRKNIGLGGGPYFVIEKKLNTNELTVSTKKIDVIKKEIELENVTFVNEVIEKQTTTKGGLVVNAKIRYQHKPARAVIIKNKNSGGLNSYKLFFSKPQTAVTPGQYAVFYIRNLVVGAGEIK